MNNLKTIDALVASLRKLPGVGVKSAERMAYSILDMDEKHIDDLILSFNGVKRITKCPICGCYEEDGICPICHDESRDRSTIIVVSSFKDVVALENIKTYHGLYHVLNGYISPSKGIGIKDINVNSLMERIDEEVKEIILATSPTIEGETTALYINRLLSDKNVKISRLAYGLPMGGSLDYADELTLSRALEGRNILRKE